MYLSILRNNSLQNEKMSMTELDGSYIVEIDGVDKDTWYKIINDFSDANIYQTWAYDEIRFGRKKMSHLILKKDDKIVAAVQVRIVRIPVINAGIAYVFWGPLWKVKNKETNPNIFLQAIRALKNEYAKRRGLLLRIYPVLFSNEADVFLPILRSEGFTPLQKEKIGRTLLVDLTLDRDTLRKGLNQKWRNCLNRAERNELELIEGDNDALFEMFIALYREMLDRKKFVAPNDIREFRLVQENLPANYKMKIMLCRLGGHLCAGAIFSAIGRTGLYLFGAVNEIGMKSNGSYLMQWKFIEWLKENQFVCYNLNGINPLKNPGTYRFKEGLCGKNGKDVHFLGFFEVCNNKFNALIVKYAILFLLHCKKVKTALCYLLNEIPSRFKTVKQQED